MGWKREFLLPMRPGPGRSSLAMPTLARWTISCPKTLKVRHWENWDMKHQTDDSRLWKLYRPSSRNIWWTLMNIRWTNDELWISWPELLRFYLLNNSWTIWCCFLIRIGNPYEWIWKSQHSEAVNLSICSNQSDRSVGGVIYSTYPLAMTNIAMGNGP